MLRQPDLLRMALWWGLSLLGAVPLRSWSPGALTAPIRRFSKAAEQLGLDISASPLPETGPAELRAAAAAINRMQDRIKRFVDDRTEMLAAISHDLRTPISRLRLRAENLPASGSERRPMIDDLQHMDRMIAATLDFARDANSGEAPCRIDLVSLVETECETLADLGRDIAYRGPSHLAFTCRPLALGRAVRNVFENAVAYGGQTLVTVIDRADRDRDCSGGLRAGHSRGGTEPRLRAVLPPGPRALGRAARQRSRPFDRAQHSARPWRRHHAAEPRERRPAGGALVAAGLGLDRFSRSASR